VVNILQLNMALDALKHLVDAQLARFGHPRRLPQRGGRGQVVIETARRGTQKPLLSFLGQPVVNILQLNMALDALKDK
jgi:K+-transporting ATPase c subunit